MTLHLEIREGFNNLDDVGKEAVSRLNIFVCGLHGLVHMVNTLERGLCEAEREKLDGSPQVLIVRRVLKK